MKVLITGANGFIAVNLIRRLLRDGHEVHAMIRNTSDLWRLADLHDQVELHVAELSRTTEVDAVFLKVRPEWLFHLATARGHANDFESYFQGNVVATVNLIDACKKYPPRKILVYGSSLEYGHRNQPLSETMADTPSTLHGTTKLCSTRLFLQAHRSFRLPVVILRLFSVYGPWESEHRLLPKALMTGIDGGTIRLTPPGIRRDFVFVEDVVEASLIALNNETANGEIINIGSGVQTTNEGLLAKINELSGHKLRVISHEFPRHETDADYWVADTRKCQALLGWSPATTLTEGLTIFQDWIHQHRHVPRYAGGKSIAHD